MLYFYILGDKMDDKTKVIIMCALSLIESILCLIALITVNMIIFLISLVMIVLELIIVLKYFELLKKNTSILMYFAVVDFKRMKEQIL